MIRIHDFKSSRKEIYKIYHIEVIPYMTHNKDVSEFQTQTLISLTSFSPLVKFSA